MENQKADLIRQLSKEWLEHGDDNVLDALKHLANTDIRMSFAYQRISERYKESVLNFHLHFVQIPDVRSAANAEDFCAVVANATKNEVAASDSSVERVCNGDRGVFCDGASQSQRSVLVDVYEMLQHPEGFRMQGLCSVVRLQRLDQCNGLIRHTVESESFTLIDEEFRLTTDRKLALMSVLGKIGRRVGVDLHELPDKMIQSRSEVMQTVANNNTEHQVQVGKVCDKLDGIHLSVCLGDKLTFFLMPLNLISYTVEMYISPDDFLPDAI